MTAEQLTIALGGNVRQGAPTQYACCPSHEADRENHTPSLAIKDGRAGVIFKCMAGCSQDDVLNALKDMGLWQQQGQAQPHIGTLELRKATLWKNGMLQYLDRDIERMNGYIMRALDSDREPAVTLQKDYRNATMQQQLLQQTPTGTDLVELFRHQLRTDERTTKRFMAAGIRLEEESVQAVQRVMEGVSHGM